MRLSSVKIVLLASIALAACGKSGSTDSSGVTVSGTAAPQALNDAQKQAALAALPAPYNTGDLLNGKRQFAVCRSCHTITPGGPNMTGPHLYGVFGRKAGSVADFKYSQAVAGAGFEWDAAHLDKWLADPRAMLPGTKMSFLGVEDAKNRADLIAYLKVETTPAAK